MSSENDTPGHTKKYKLTEDQLKFYEENGYLVIRKLIDESLLNTLTERFKQICKGDVPTDDMWVVPNKNCADKEPNSEDRIDKIQHIFYDEVFSRYFEHPAVVDVVSHFIGDHITGVHNNFFNKPPGSNQFAPHQDLYYFPIRPVEKIMTAWTAIDEVTIDNGCLYVVPRSHKQGKLYGHGYPEYKSTKLILSVVDEEIVAPQDQRLDLEMKPGDTVFFHSLLLHGSRKNLSKKNRKAISCHYASSDCHYIDVVGTIQERLDRESVEVLKTFGHKDPTLRDLFHTKCKIVRGDKTNL